MVTGNVGDRVCEAQTGERGQAQRTGIATATGTAVGCGVVATVGEAEVNSEFAPAEDDLLLVQRQERRVDHKSASSLNARLGRQVGQCFESAEEFGATVGIPRVVDAVHP